jgi:multimeric flavodoxin WrbA
MPPSQPDPNDVAPRKGMPGTELSRDVFRRRFLEQFSNPRFEAIMPELEKAVEIAWQAYVAGEKSPETRTAGPAFANPDYDLSCDWLAAHEALRVAKERHENRERPRILIINGSPRSEHTCPGEMSKSWRLVQIAAETIAQRHASDIEVLDLSRLTSEYGRNIYPCKACFSTAAPLCHWPCSCYPNHSLGQTQDWMNEIYPMWVAAHGVMIITPVHWYQASSALKLMIDRLVCADGGNPDPTLTRGKDAGCAKKIELEGWNYPRHLEGRLFSVVVHGDVEGVENLRRALSDWMCFMHMLPAGPKAELDRYIGYWKPYATSHEELDADKAFQQEVSNAAMTLIDGVVAHNAGGRNTSGLEIKDPRQK